MEPKEQEGQGGRASPQVQASFLDHLVKHRVITADQSVMITNWRQHNPEDKRSVVDLLEQELKVERDIVRQQIAQYYAFRVIDSRDRSVRRLLPSEINKILRSLSDSVVQQLLKAQLLPYDLAENQPDKIVLVTPNPSDREIHRLARLLPYKKFEICYLKESSWNEFRQLLNSERGQPVPEVQVTAVSDVPESDFEGIMDREITRTQLNSQLDNIFADAVRTGASEIHFIPLGARKTNVLFRLEGHLSLWASMDDVRSEAVITALKASGINLDRYERLAAQQGMIHRLVEKRPLRMSVSTIPVVSRDPGMRYETAVLHVMRESESVPSINNIGLDDHSAEVLGVALAGMRGLVLVAGFDHKTLHTTVAASLRAIAKPAVNIVTVEDPVEFLVDGVRQIKLNPRLSKSDAIRSLAVHDPDVVALGDIDDPAIAEVALRMANIGQLVFCSIHARDGATALARLFRAVGNGLLLSDALTAVIAQQTVRTLCPRCKQPLPPALLPRAAAHLRLLAGEVAPSTIHRAVGCIDCRNGYRGHEVLFEAIRATPGIRDVLASAENRLDTGSVLRTAELDGMIPLRKKAIDLVEQGLTTVDQLLAFAV
jgi:type IV pilus assembly protein PilB